MYGVFKQKAVYLISGFLAISPLNAFADNIEQLSAACSACHGAKGVSVVDTFPNLAGQQRNYLARQMRAFRDGDRKEASMAASVKNLSDGDIDKLADYYASFEWVSASAQKPKKKKEKVQTDTKGENYSSKCIACHGMKGKSVTSEWPNIAGQKQAYFEKTLLDIKSGSRHSPLMNVIVNELNNEQIKALAKYYSEL